MLLARSGCASLTTHRKPKLPGLPQSPLTPLIGGLGKTIRDRDRVGLLKGVQDLPLEQGDTGSNEFVRELN